MPAYLYKWTELSTNKWYVGCRWSKKAHPNDGYICSSKLVRPLIKENPNNWERKILCIGNAEYITQLEKAYLELLDAKNNPQSYNCSNNEFGMTKATYGMKGRKHSKETRELMSLKAKIYCKDPLVKKRRSELTKGANNPRFGKPGTWIGRTHTQETKDYIAFLASQRKYGPRPKIQCPYCDIKASKNTFVRYHGDKCKQKQ